ncbi:MAG: T9SS type A sorting domain-containing protein [Bacteroidia bacterium]|nr:T9SS type A sorting domain-containing protein [Bacteroidia bacterium]MDW8159323.1 T9SS type A sorting domain-containing protein [Bacteroidia bacterium]
MLLLGQLLFVQNLASSPAPLNELPTKKSAAFYFIQNKGQIYDNHGNFREELLYQAQTPSSLFYYFAKNRISIVVPHYDFLSLVPNQKFKIQNKRVRAITKLLRIDWELLNTNPKVQVLALEPQKVTYRYFQKSLIAPTIAPAFAALLYKEIYPGIDLKFYPCPQTGNLKYEFIVSPGANPSQIQFRYAGIQDLELQKNGNLTIKTLLGNLEEKAPYSFQNIQGRIKEINSYFLYNDKKISFGIQNYDTTQPLIIDPTVFWSTYVGGSNIEVALDVFVTPNGFCLKAGYTSSVDYPVSPGEVYEGGNTDGILSIFDNEGEIIAGNFIGGNNQDFLTNVTVSSQGKIAIAGTTNSTNIPFPASSYQGGIADAFIMVFDPNGNFEWGRYYGGLLGGRTIDNTDGLDQAISIHFDNQQNIYLVGNTYSMDIPFPLFPPSNTYLQNQGGGLFADFFIARFNAPSYSLFYATYYGSALGNEFALSTDFHPNYGLVVGGTTFSPNFPTTTSSFQANFGGGDQDGFIVAFNPNLTRKFASFIGGSNNDNITAIDIGNNQLLVFAGNTFSTNLNTLAPSNAFLQTTLKGQQDIYIGCLNTLNNLRWLTYLGGQKEDAVLDLVYSPAQYLTLVGFSESQDFPAINSVQSNLKGNEDIIILRFNPDFSLLWSTFWGGAGNESGNAIGTDAGENAYIVGTTTSADFPLINPLQNFDGLNGTQDNIFVKIGKDCSGVVGSIIFSQKEFCEGSSEILSIVAFPPFGELRASCGNCLSNNTINVSSLEAGTYSVTYIANDEGCLVQVSDNFIIKKVQEPVSILTNVGSVCENSGPITLIASPTGGTFEASCGTCITQNSIFLPEVAGAGEHLIRYRRRSIEGCDAEDVIFIRVDRTPTISFDPPLAPAYCINSSPVPLNATPRGGTFKINNRPVPNNLLVPSSLAPGRYTLIYEGQVGSCAYVAIQNFTINAPPNPSLTAPSEVCPQEPSVRINVSPPDGILSGPGIDNTTRTFLPAVAGVGIHTINYSGILEGCTYQTSIQIKVKEVPLASISGLSNTVCANAEPIPLRIQPTGGSLSINPPTAALQGGLFIPRQAAPGTYQIIYSGLVQGCAYTTSQTFTIIAAPEARIENLSDTYCTTTAAPITLIGIPSGGRFSGSGVLGNTLFINSLSPGRYSITYSGEADGCSYTTTRTFTLTLGPQAPLVIDAPNEACEGTNVILRPSIQDPTLIYSWRGPRGFITSSPLLTLNNFDASQAGTYEVTVTYPNCTTLTASKTISTVLRATPTRIETNAPVCEGQTLILSVASFPQTSYSWSGPNGFTATEATIQRFVSQLSFAGEYSVRVEQPICQVDVRLSIAVFIQPQLQLSLSSNAPVCVGQTLRLSSNAPEEARLYWRGPAGVESFNRILEIPNVQLLNTGTYTLVARSGVCPPTNATIDITIRGVPDTISALSNSPICLNSELTLKSYGAPASTCTWLGPNNTTYEGCIINIPNATSSLMGLYTLTVNVPGCPPLQRVINVEAAPLVSPPILSSNSPVCSGTPLNITAQFQAGSIIFWQGPNNFRQSGGSTVIINNAREIHAGTYRAYAVQGKCTSQVATMEIKVIGFAKLPEIQTNSPVCAGTMLSLSANLPPGSNYLWLGPNGFQAQTESAFIDNISSVNQGVYTLSTSVDGCPSISLTTSVQVLPAVTLEGGNNQNLNLCSGDILQLRALGPPQARYLWNGPLGFSSTNPTISRQLSAGQDGTYTLLGFVGNCTTQASVNVRVNARPPAPTTPKNIRLCAGATLTLSGNFSSGATPLWQGPDNWSSSLRFSIRNDIQQNQGGVYSAVAIQNGCTSVAATTLVEVLPLPSATLQTIGTVVTCNNSPVILNIQLRGTSPLSLHYTLNGQPFEANNLSSQTSQWEIVPLANSNQTLLLLHSITDGNGCTAAVRGEVVIRQIAPTPIIIEPTSIAQCGSNSGLCIRAGSISGQPLQYSINGSNFSTQNCFSNLSIGRHEIAVKEGFCISRITYELKRGVMPPLTVEINSVNYGGATVRWSSVNGAISYALRYREVNAPTWIEVNNLFTTLYTFNQLRAAREYEVQIRYNCSSQDASDYSESVRFTTLPQGSQPKLQNFSSLPTLTLYPNPTHGKILVHFENLPSAEDALVIINDALGKEVYRIMITQEQLQEKKIELDLSTLTSGVYTLTLQENQMRLTERFILQR